MDTNQMELSMDELAMVNGGADAFTKGTVSGLSVVSFAVTGGMFGSFAGPVGTAVGALVGGAVGGISAAVVFLVGK